MLMGYPRAAQTSASETPVLPPVYSTTRPPGFRRSVRSPASIMARAMRSFMLPVGLTHSTLIKIRAQPFGTMRLSSSTGVPPMRSRTDASIRRSLLFAPMVCATVGTSPSCMPADYM